MSDIPFEYMALAVPESVAGTPESAPLSYFNLAGKLKPERTLYKPEEQSGTLAKYMRSLVTRRWGTFDADGGLDPNILPQFLELIAKGGVTAVQPALGVLTYDWDYAPTMDSDDLVTATLWYGDPNMTQIQQGAFGIIDELQIAGDASGTDGVTISLSGMSTSPVKVTPPTAPTRASAPLMAALRMQLFLDTSSAIGTTEITGKVVSAQHSFVSGRKPRFVAVGPTGGLTYSKVGRETRNIVARVEVEFDDFDEYDLFAADDVPVKMRVIYNGGLIESVTPDYYYGVTVDAYGQLELTDYGDNEGVVRTLVFEIETEFETAAAADWAISVRNTLATLPT